MKDHSTVAATYAGSLLALFSVNEWCMVFGAAISALAFLYNVYYKERMLKMLRDKPEVTIKED